MKLKSTLTGVLSACYILGSTLIPAAPVLASTYSGQYNELYRPQFHYTPGQKWMNDPNGMFYLDGEYHLFYQYYPDGIEWGPMHWGHAVSTDLVHWTEMPIALFPDDIGMAFSGSAVVDYNNTSGLGINGQPPIIAIYTSARTENGVDIQEQSIAYSNDKGRTWKKYNGNPVIPTPTAPGESADFRDPKVFWYDEGIGKGHWVMTIVQHDEARVFTSPDLKNWKQTDSVRSTTNLDITNPDGDWECPEIFPLQVDGGATTKWVMTVSINPGAKYGSGTVYMIGDFDGQTFTNKQTFEDGKDFQYLDLGSDNYAGVTWSNVPNSQNKKTFIGWMSNWRYGTSTPTDPAGTWRSAMTTPRTLELKTINGKVRLIDNPVSQLDSIKGTAQTWTNQTIIPGGGNLLSGVNSKQYELTAVFRTDNTTATEFGFKVRTGGSQYTRVYYDKTNQQLKIDRSQAGARPSFNAGDFDIIHNATAVPVNNTIKMKILVDASSVELFGNDGVVSMTDVIFPDDASRGAQLYTVGGNVTVNSLSYTPINSATPTQAPTYVQGAKELKNHDFETGDLSGWTVLSGNAFTDADVTNLATAVGGNGQTFNKNGNFHLWSFKNGGDAETGTIKSENFILNSGNIDFLVSGGNDITNLKVSLVRASDGYEIAKSTGANSEIYTRTTWSSASLASYVGNECYIKVTDTATGGFGHINLDDINVPIKAVEGIANHDFETADLTGWKVFSGNAFKTANVSDKSNWWGGTYDQNNNNFLSGYTEGQDKLTGELRSQNFIVSGNGKIDLKVSGGNDILNEYVALVRASDNAILYQATGTDSDTLRTVSWDASAFLGTECYIAVVDKSIGSWGHINVDDVNVGTFSTNLTGAWTTVGGGTWSNATGGKLGTNASGDSFQLNGQTASDFILEGDLKLVGGTASGLVFRANSSATQFYCANIDKAGQVKLWKAGGAVLGTFNTPISDNVTYKLKVVATGSNIKVYLNNSADPVINVNDTSYTTGQIGVNIYNGASKFDDIKLSKVNTNLKGFYNVSGTWSEIAGGKQGVAAANTNAFSMSTSQGSDFTYEGDLKVTATGAAAGLVFRSDNDATKFYCANIDSTGFVKLWGPGLPDRTAAVSIVPNTDYHLKVVTSGDNIKVYFNNGSIPVIDVNDGTYKGTRLGVNVWNGTGIIQNIVKH